MKELSERTELTKLGLTVGLAIIFLFGIAAPLIHHHPYSVNSLLTGFLLIITATLQPNALKPFSRFWKYIGHTLGFINLRIILGIMFFCIIVPIGIIKRTIGNRSLALTFDPKATTYRIISTNANPKQMEKPF